jgi:hypothetical protein
MPIAADSNVPTVAGYLQSVTFHLINRDGEKIDLEDFTSSMAIYARAIVDLGKLHAVKK